MAHVVFTTIDSLDDLGAAKWLPGNDESYTGTKRMVPDQRDIRLIGRQATNGRVQLCYASFGLGEWEPVNAWHLALARYFEKKLAHAPAGDLLPVFFSTIDDVDAANAAQQLLAAECGINVKKEPWGALHLAILRVQQSLKALGLGCGDWSFVPMLNSFETSV